MKKFLHHLRHFLVPHESNNHRPKLLHEHVLLILVLLITVTTFSLKTVEQKFPEVLGIQANISQEELLELTNQKRAEKGLKPLTMNPKLAAAASQKAKFMFEKNFWAHISPDGTTPWFFIRNAEYEYVYAGENLARGYTTASEVVDAWMASPSHRENIMSPNYSDIGFAVATGDLTGNETVLVVEMFGTEMPSSTKQIASENASASAATEQIPMQQDIPPNVVAQVQASGQTAEQPIIDSNTVTQRIALFLIALLIGVLIIDAIVIERKRIARVVAHNTDHIAFLLLILFAVMILEKGYIL